MHTFFCFSSKLPSKTLKHCTLFSNYVFLHFWEKKKLQRKCISESKVHKRSLYPLRSLHLVAAEKKKIDKTMAFINVVLSKRQCLSLSADLCAWKLASGSTLFNRPSRRVALLQPTLFALLSYSFMPAFLLYIVSAKMVFDSETAKPQLFFFTVYFFFRSSSGLVEKWWFCSF